MADEAVVEAVAGTAPVAEAVAEPKAEVAAKTDDAGISIPKHRFDEVNTRMQAAERRLAEMEAAQAKPVEKQIVAPVASPESAQKLADEVVKERFGADVTLDQLDPTEKYVVQLEVEKREARAQADISALQSGIENALKNPAFEGMNTDFNAVLAHMDKSGIFNPLAAARDLYFDDVVKTKSETAANEALTRKAEAAAAGVEPGGKPSNSGVVLSFRDETLARVKAKREARG